MSLTLAKTGNPLPPHEDGLLVFRPDVLAMACAHWHAELELNFVTHGRAAYLLSARRYDLRPRSLVWLFAEQEHILLDKSPEFQSWLGVFSPALLADCCRSSQTRGCCCLTRRATSAARCRKTKRARWKPC